MYSYSCVTNLWRQVTPLFSPNEKISHSSTPKDHTSLCVVYTLSKMLSGAIHFRGSRAWEGKKRYVPWWRREG